MNKDDGDITYDRIYKAVQPNNLDAMIEVDRYNDRSNIFDSLISQTHDHFWDPMDVRYVDYSINFDLNSDLVLPEEMFSEFNTPTINKLDSKTKIRLANENTRWLISSLLHGEQAAFCLCTQMSSMLLDPGAQEYAANQAREEARHVSAFSRYIKTRWGKPYKAGSALSNLLNELVDTPNVYMKLIGMQILVEGLAMGLLTVIYATTHDPLLKRITQLVISDETYHHKFGKTWAEKTIPFISPEEHNQVEDWAAYCFEKLILNLVNIDQRQQVFENLGLDWYTIKADYLNQNEIETRKVQLQQQGNIFRVLVKTLINSNIVTARTLPIYAQWINIKMLEQESDPLDIIGQLIAQESIIFLKDINGKRRSVLKQKR